MADPVAGLDETFHAPARLGIMTMLLQERSRDFPTLKRTLGLTDGNLGAHIRVLEQAGYIEVEKNSKDASRARYAASHPAVAARSLVTWTRSSA